MKKILLAILLVFLLCGYAAASPDIGNVVTANSVPFAWDPVTNDSGIVLYRVSIQQINPVDESPIGSPIVLTSPEIAETQFTVTFPSQGVFILGVTAILVDALGNTLAESGTAWSNVPADCLNGETFAAQYYIVNKASGLQILQP